MSLQASPEPTERGFMAKTGKGTFSGAMQDIINRQDEEITRLKASLAAQTAALGLANESNTRAYQILRSAHQKLKELGGHKTGDVYGEIAIFLNIPD